MSFRTALVDARMRRRPWVTIAIVAILLLIGTLGYRTLSGSRNTSSTASDTDLFATGSGSETDFGAGVPGAPAAAGSGGTSGKGATTKSGSSTAAGSTSNGSSGSTSGTGTTGAATAGATATSSPPATSPPGPTTTGGSGSGSVALSSSTFATVATFTAPSAGSYALSGSVTVRQTLTALIGTPATIECAWFDGSGATQLGASGTVSMPIYLSLTGTPNEATVSASGQGSLGASVTARLQCRFQGVALPTGGFTATSWTYQGTRS